MSRRVSLPGANELFGGTAPQTRPETRPPTTEAPAGREPGLHGPVSRESGVRALSGAGTREAVDDDQDRANGRSVPRSNGRAEGRSRTAVAEDRRSSGRIRHDTKITVYVTEEELLGLEQTRLALRAEHGLTADRGRIVREAIDVLLADFVDHGPDSVLVQRLRAE